MDSINKTSIFNMLGVWLAVIIALTLIMHGSYMHAKAQLAQYLLQKTWHLQQANAQKAKLTIENQLTVKTTRYTNENDAVDIWAASASVPPLKPWPWFDSYAIAKLHFPSLNQQRIVLAGDSGQALAFAPGMSFSSAAFGNAGTVVIAGHRDTHFSILQYLNPSEVITLEDVEEQVYHYKISNIRVIDIDKEQITQTDFSRLILVTCYPFDSDEPNTTLRYIIEALPIDKGNKLDVFTVFKKQNYAKKLPLILANNSMHRFTQAAEISF